jgi:hypothetical protein
MHRICIFMACLALLTAEAVEAQQGGKKPSSQPASAQFRCPGADCPQSDPDADPPVISDMVMADLWDTAYEPLDGTRIDTYGEFALYMEATGRYVTLDFSDGPAPCSTCRRTFTTIAIDSSYNATLHTNVIDPATGKEAADGLRSIPLGATWRARLNIAFNTTGPAGETIRWAVRFNPRDYYPSDHIWVTRTASDTWELYSTSAERAMLVSVCCRQKGYTNEGLYVMPFRISLKAE